MDENKPKLELSEKPIIKKRTGWEIFKDHLKAIGNYLWGDILEPAMKDTVSNMAKSAVDMALYGETRNDDRRDSRRDYNRISTSYYRSDSRRDRRDDYARRDTYRDDRNIDDIVFSNIGDANKFLDYLNSQLDQYGQVYMADVYSELGVESGFTDYNRGWESLRDAYVDRVRNGYRVVLPRPKVLK